MNKKTRSKQGVGATLVAIGILLCYVNTAGAVPILVSQGLDAAAYTSSSDLTASFTAVKAFDGDLNNTKWVANGTPVQWIEVDLGKPCDLGYIELTAEGTRDSVNHEIWVSLNPIGSDTTGAKLISTVIGVQTSGVARSAMLAEYRDRRYVQVRTTALSPNAYPAWREVRVYVVPEPGILVSQGRGTGAYTSSSVLNASYTTHNAFDGNVETKWIAANTPMQWIEVDLGQPYDLRYIDLTPEGTKPSVNHEIWVSSSPIGNDTTGATLINTVTGSQTPYVVRSAMLTELTDRRYVQVRTTALSPDGYVAWKEIQVYKGLPPSATVFVVR